MSGLGTSTIEFTMPTAYGASLDAAYPFGVPVMYIPISMRQTKCTQNVGKNMRIITRLERASKVMGVMEVMRDTQSESDNN